MVDIARPESVKRKKKIRRILYGAVALLAVVAVSIGVSRLRPAAPGVDRATVWIDTVKRGPMTRQVRGSGTLVPEDIRWIPATTQGTRRADPAETRRGSEAGHSHPRDEQPRPAAAGQGCAARIPIRSGGVPEQEGGPRQPVPQPAGGRGDDRSQLQSGQAGPRGERAAAEGWTGIGADRQTEAHTGEGPGESAEDRPAAAPDDERGPAVPDSAAGSGCEPEACGVRAAACESWTTFASRPE